VNRNDAASVMDSGRPRVKSRTRVEECRRPRGTGLHANSRDYKSLVQTRADLAAAVGGQPSVIQQLLIEQASQLKLRLRQADNEVVADTAMTVAESKHYIALANALTRVLLRLGVDEKAKAKPAVPNLAEFLAERERRAAAP